GVVVMPPPARRPNEPELLHGVVVMPPPARRPVLTTHDLERMEIFTDAHRLFGWAVMGVILFSSLFLTCLIYFHIKEVDEGVLLAKIISLLALAAFGQSEALNFYLKHHSEASVSAVSLLNKIGIGFTFICVSTVGLKLLMDKNVIELGSASGGLEALVYHAEALSFFPIIIFFLVEVFVWWRV